MLLGLIGVARTLFLLQAVQSSVTGTITGADGNRPLSYAVVMLADLDRAVMTDSSGHYRFTDVPPGPQHLTVRCLGYAPRVLHVMVPAEGPLQVDVALRPVPINLPPLSVRSPLSLRGLESGDSTAFPDRGVSLAAVRNDPMLAEPDGLLGLSGGEIAALPESPSGINLRGAPSDQTGYLLDGVPVFSPYHAAGTFSAWNPDALERLQVSSASPPLDFPEALSGTVSAFTRAPGSALRVQGGMSTSQMRLAVDGPLGSGGAGYLVSYRTGFPALLATHEASYLGGETSDLILKSQAPAFGGSLHLLWYQGDNSIGSIVSPAPGGPIRNRFEWGSRSFGAGWVRRVPGGTVRIQSWSAASDAEAAWPAAVPLALNASRQDEGVQATLERSGGLARTTAGIRLERSHTRYRIASADNRQQPLTLAASTPVATLFLQQQRPIAHDLGSIVGISAAEADNGLHLGLQGQLRWEPSGRLSLIATYARTHQFAQSLRNPESVVGNVFPPDLYLGAGARGVPVARGDRAVLAADYRLGPSFRVGAQAYVTRYHGLLLVAPGTTGPFVSGNFVTGTGTAPGASLDASMSGSRVGLLARYGWQRVRLQHGDSSYTPSYGTSHLLELGGIVFPSATSSVRLGLTGGWGRAATAIAGTFEWEACNLLDRGCEFGGTPSTTGSLGDTRLPSYLRLDLGVRQHWHLTIGRRDVTLALFGTLTNLLARTNVLTIAVDPETGHRSAIEMRPLSPLVVGLDWRF